VGRAGRSGEDGFRQFYDRVHDRVTSTAVRMVRDRTTGEDLAAEALARAFSHWRTVHRHPNPDAWVMTVVGNLAIDHVRRSGRDDMRDAQLRHLHLDVPAPDQVALRVDLARALAGLSSRQRDVVLMRYYADMSEREVADALRISAGAVKNHLHRATTRLRTDLNGSDPTPGTDGIPATRTQPPPPPMPAPTGAATSATEPNVGPRPESPHAIA